MDKLIITGSGRCGTVAFAEAFGGLSEYGVKRLFKAMPELTKQFPREYAFREKENRIKGMEIMYKGMDKYDPFIDSNNFARHFLDVFYEKYPDTKFLLLTRNGKDFAVSAGNRLWDMYNTTDHIPLVTSFGFPDFIESSRLEKLAWIWFNSNMLMLTRAENIPEKQKMMVKIEDCDLQMLEKIEDFAGIKMKDKKKILSKKVNRNTFTQFFVPVKGWTIGMHVRFDGVAGQMMKTLGYINAR